MDVQHGMGLKKMQTAHGMLSHHNKAMHNADKQCTCFRIDNSRYCESDDPWQRQTTLMKSEAANSKNRRNKMKNVRKKYLKKVMILKRQRPNIHQ